MVTPFKRILSFPHFDVVISSDTQDIFNLVIRQFPKIQERYSKGLSRLTVHFFYHKTSYSKIPRFPRDSFHEFPLFSRMFAQYDFKNQRYENCRIIYDVGPRAINTIIEPKDNRITSYLAVPDDLEKDLLFDLIFFQPLKCLLQIKGLYLFHASCVVAQEKGILISGPPGSGKSTIAFSLLKEGVDFLADDRVILYQKNNKVQCSPLPSCIKIPEKNLKFFPHMSDTFKKHHIKREKVLMDMNKITSCAETCDIKPSILIFPQFVSRTKTRIERLKKQTVLSRLQREEFMKVKFTGSNIYLGYFLVLTALLRQVECYRLFFRNEDLSRIPDIIHSLLKRV